MARQCLVIIYKTDDVCNVSGLEVAFFLTYLMLSFERYQNHEDTYKFSTLQGFLKNVCFCPFYGIIWGYLENILSGQN
jgi:hypothetical protein